MAFANDDLARRFGGIALASTTFASLTANNYTQGAADVVAVTGEEPWYLQFVLQGTQDIATSNASTPVALYLQALGVDGSTGNAAAPGSGSVAFDQPKAGDLVLSSVVSAQRSPVLRVDVSKFTNQPQQDLRPWLVHAESGLTISSVTLFWAWMSPGPKVSST